MPSNEIDKKQEKTIDQRPNYFAGQYLLEDDFQLEQKYHIDRQRRHNRLLHVSGIAEGLEVSKDKDLAVKVSAGTAIDSQGRQIILPGDQPVDLGKIANTNELKDSEYILSIRYEEELRENQDSEENTHRRVQEKPAFELSTSTTPDIIPIAKLIIKGGKVESIDSTERVYSGICLPTENEKGVTLRSSHGKENPNLAVLTGSLSISGALEVKGGSTLIGNVKANGSLTVTNSGTGRIAEFNQEGSGGGVYIGGVKGKNSALSISGNETESSTLYVANKGSGLIANFTQQGSGGGVWIGGVKGEQNALNIAGNETINPTFAVANKGSGYVAQFIQQGEGDGVYIGGVKGNHNALNITNNETNIPTFTVTNKGTGTALFVDQQGTGLAAEFKGKVVASKGIEVSGYLTIERHDVTVAQEKLMIISGRVDRNGNRKEGNGFTVKKIEEEKEEKGIFLITFSPEFTGIPTVVSTQYYNNSFAEGKNGFIEDFKQASGKTTDNVVVVAVDREKLKIKTGDGGGNGTHREFGFIAIGLR